MDYTFLTNFSYIHLFIDPLSYFCMKVLLKVNVYQKVNELKLNVYSEKPKPLKFQLKGGIHFMCRIIHLHMDELGFISQWRAIFAGGLAGVAAALVTYPLEVAETRLIIQNCRQPTYIGVAHTLSKIYRNEGLQALYRGFSLTVLGVYAYFLKFSDIALHDAQTSDILCWFRYQNITCTPHCRGFRNICNVCVRVRVRVCVCWG